MTVVEDGAGRTGLGFAKKQGPRAPRRAPARQTTTAQKKARLRPAQRNTLGALSNNANEAVAEAARSNTPSAVGSSAALNPPTTDEDSDVRDADALFVGDGTLVESWDSTLTGNTSVSHPPTATFSHNLSNNSTGGAGTINNAHRLSQAAFAPANLVAQSTTHVESAALTTAITPIHHSTSFSRISQTPQLIAGSVGGARDYSHYQSIASVGDVWDYQHTTYTDEPFDCLQGASSHVSQTPQPIPSHTTDRSTNSTGGIWDSEAMGFTGMPSSYLMGRVDSSGTSQETVSFGAPSVVNSSSFIRRGNQSGYGQRSNDQCGDNQRSNGQSDNGQLGYGQRDNGQHGYGQRDNGQRDSGHLSYGQRSYGQLQGGAENSGGFNLRNPLEGLVSGSGTGTYHGAYGGGFSAYGIHENTFIPGLSEPPIYPPSGSHNRHGAFSGAAANNFSVISHTPAAGNATYDWQTNPALGLSGTGEHSAVLGATAEHAASGQTPAAFPTTPVNNATGTWGIDPPSFRNENIQD